MKCIGTCFRTDWCIGLQIRWWCVWDLQSTRAVQQLPADVAGFVDLVEVAAVLGAVVFVLEAPQV
jgi:hypothetical protein